MDAPQPPQQQRSRQTFDSLLAATIRLLESDTLEACTLPRIATEAGLAAASVYRRFPDKAALLRAAFLHVLQQNAKVTRPQLEKLLLRKSLQATIEAIVLDLLRQYRARPRLMRSLSLFLESHSGTAFALEARQLISTRIELTAALLLEHRDRIRHPNPARAVVFAVLFATSMVESAILTPDSLWSVALPFADKQLAAEITRAALAFLRRKP
jgi:AcrR family transcriptional regulator